MLFLNLRKRKNGSSPLVALIGGNEVILCENEKIVSDQREVCNIFNNYFVNVAKDIGNDTSQYNQDFSSHPSIEKILENNPLENP